MSTRLQKFIDAKLTSAQYEYDESVGQWTGWVSTLKGVYSQGENIESVREELAEIMEEQIFLSVSEHKPMKGFSLKLPVNA